MYKNVCSLQSSLKVISDDAIKKGFFSPRDKRDLKALDQLAESYQDDACQDEWLLFFKIRSEIADLLDSEMSIHF